MRIGRAVSDACRASDAVRARTVSGCPNGLRYIYFGKSATRPMVRAFCRKRRFLKSAEHNNNYYNFIIILQ